MECPHCHHTLTSQHKFCSECGAPVASETESQQGSTGNREETSPFAQAIGQYWRFARQSLATPVTFGSRLGGGDAWNGSLSVLVCSFFMANLYYMTAGNLFNLFMGFLKYAPYRYGWLDHFVRPFIWLVVLHAVVAGSIYAAARLMKANVSFRDVAARYGSMLTVPAVLFAISSFFVLVRMFKLASYVSLLGMVGLLAAAGFTVFSFGNDEEKGGLDPFYGAMAAFIIAGVSLYFLGELLV